MKPLVSQKDIEKTLKSIFFVGLLLFSGIVWFLKAYLVYFVKNSCSDKRLLKN